MEITLKKGYTGYYTDEIFKISEIIKTTPITYKVKDLDNNEEIIGTFFQNEPSPTDF